MNEAFSALVTAKRFQHVTYVGDDGNGYSTFITLPVIMVTTANDVTLIKANGGKFTFIHSDVAAITTCANNSVWVRLHSAREEILLSW